MPVRFLKKRVLSPITEFVAAQSSGALLLFAAAVLALLLANSIYASDFFSVLNWRLPWSSADGLAQQPLQFWVNDGLMAIFFLLVGLEIKRELVVGELSTFKQAAFPVAAAMGGMIIPAVIYLSMTRATPHQNGWGIPVATDIAFSLGVLGLLGKKAPLSLKIFLTAFAIADDLGAVVVIALFYSAGIHLLSLLGCAACGIALLILNFRKTQSVWPFLAVGLLLWYACYRAGINTTISGIVTALFIPIRNGTGTGSPAERLEHALENLVGFWIIPLFGFANAGVKFTGGQGLSDPISLGVVLGLVIGKPLGIFGFAWLSVKSKLAKLPPEIQWQQVLGVGMLGGIGFTMSLFTSGLAFQDLAQQEASKVGILLGSLVSGVLGAVFLSVFARRRASKR